MCAKRMSTQITIYMNTALKFYDSLNFRSWWLEFHFKKVSWDSKSIKESWNATAAAGSFTHLSEESVFDFCLQLNECMSGQNLQTINRVMLLSWIKDLDIPRKIAVALR